MHGMCKGHDFIRSQLISDYKPSAGYNGQDGSWNPWARHELDAADVLQMVITHDLQVTPQELGTSAEVPAATECQRGEWHYHEYLGRN